MTWLLNWALVEYVCIWSSQSIQFRKLFSGVRVDVSVLTQLARKLEEFKAVVVYLDMLQKIRLHSELLFSDGVSLEDGSGDSVVWSADLGSVSISMLWSSLIWNTYGKVKHFKLRVIWKVKYSKLGIIRKYREQNNFSWKLKSSL